MCLYCMRLVLHSPALGRPSRNPSYRHVHRYRYTNRPPHAHRGIMKVLMLCIWCYPSQINVHKKMFPEKKSLGQIQFAKIACVVLLTNSCSCIMSSGQRSLGQEWPRNKMVAPIITRKQMLMSKSTQSSLQGLPQSAVVVIAMCSNYYKSGKPETVKSQKMSIFFFLSGFLSFFLSFFLQSAQHHNAIRARSIQNSH